jgi:hypothetical protein
MGTEEKDSLDDVLSKVNLTEKNEFEAMAEQIHKETPSRSNISGDEASACFRCNVIFPAIGLDEENPVDMFLELKKSQLGWATEKFVQCTNGALAQKQGMMGALGQKLFTPNGGGGQ